MAASSLRKPNKEVTSACDAVTWKREARRTPGPGSRGFGRQRDRERTPEQVGVIVPVRNGYLTPETAARGAGTRRAGR